MQPTTTVDAVSTPHGAFSADPEASRALYLLLFLGLIFISFLGLQSLLIALINNSFSRHLESQRAHWYIEVARACMLLDCDMSSRQRLSRDFAHREWGGTGVGVFTRILDGSQLPHYLPRHCPRRPLDAGREVTFSPLLATVDFATPPSTPHPYSHTRTRRLLGMAAIFQRQSVREDRWRAYYY